MLKILTIAALLVASPVLAKTSVTKPAQKSECVSPEKLIAGTPSKFKLRTNLSGDDLRKFETNLLKDVKGMPDGVSRVVIYNVDETVDILIMFTGGCVSGVGHLPVKLVEKFLADGSI